MFLSTDTSAQAHFAQVPVISNSRNSFSIAMRHVTTMQFDKLVPMVNMFIYPGDTLSGTFYAMCRLGTQVGTLYDDLMMDYHAWFTPFRILHTTDGWARLMYNAQPAGPTQDNSTLTTPGISLAALTGNSFAAKSNYDYLGYGDPSINVAASTIHINNYYCRGLHCIWNNNYRDQNLQTPLTLDLDFGPDDGDDYKTLLPRGKRHDMVTSLLTALQKGQNSAISVGNTSPVISNDSQMRMYSTPAGLGSNAAVSFSGAVGVTTGAGPVNGEELRWHLTNTGLVADTTLLQFTVNAMRVSVAVQHLLEADARGGTRDIEAIQNRWGVTVPDYRLSRPEYLGGATYNFDGHVVPQTSETAGTPQATLAQFSQMMSKLEVNHSFTEAGCFFILASARSNITYQEMLPRELRHQTRLDFINPEFANLGEVAMQGSELCFTGVDASDNAVQGYNEYGYWGRYQNNRVSSEMRSSFATSKDYLHMADDYGGVRPTLSAAFIVSQTPISRNLVVDTATADPIEVNSIFKGSIARILPMYSIPGLTRL